MGVLQRSLGKLKRKLKTRRGKKITLIGLAAVVAGASIGSAVYWTQRRLVVDLQTYRPLLDLIGQAEGRDNYDAYFGQAGNKKTRFTQMTISEVLRWQDKFVADGSPSSAVGRYQILNTTLRSLIDEGAAYPEQVFDESTQDKLAMALLDRRGGEDYVNDELSRHDYAANLAKEWASLPKMTGDNPEKSFYESHLNAALVKPRKVLEAIDHIESK